jgi:hypothetical protein
MKRMSRILRRLLAISCIALVSMHGAQAGPSAPDTGPKPPAPVVCQGFTDQFIGKILMLIALEGSDQELDSILANALGFSPVGGSWANHQVATQDHAANAYYGFAISRKTDQDVLLQFRKANTVSAFRAHRDGTLVSAASYNVETGQLAKQTADEAQAAFAAQCLFWTSKVDSLNKGG